MMWKKCFMEAQGYSIDSNILFQDNQSTIQLSKNGSISAGNKSKHIENLYFFITDKVHQEDQKIHYKPTGRMLDDYQCRHQKGNIFRNMRAHLMNCPINNTDDK